MINKYKDKFMVWQLHNRREIVCAVAGLAYYLGQEIAPERSQELERRYEAELQRALTEDSQSTSVNIVPRSFYVG